MTWYWIFMLIVDLLIPVTMIVFGKRFAARPPENINQLFGYRTDMSMKNRETWDFAHRCFGKIWFVAGLILLPVSAVPLFFVWGGDENAIGIMGLIVCTLQLLPMLLPIAFTEKELKKAFDGQGQRRNP